MPVRDATGAVVAFGADRDSEPEGVGWSVLLQGVCQQVTRPGLIEELRSLPLTAWSTDDDVFLRLPLAHVSGELVYWCQPETFTAGRPLC